MKSVFGFVITILLGGCSSQGWSRIDCPEFQGDHRQGFAELFQRISWTINETSHGNRARHPAKKQMTPPLQREMESLELVQSSIQFSNERMRISNPIKAVHVGKSAGSENLKAKKIIGVKKLVRNVRSRAVVCSESMSSKSVEQEKRLIPFAAVLGILSLGFSGLGWLLLLGSGGYAVFLGLLGALGGFISILVGLYGLNKEWKRAARWAIILGILAILLNPISFFIATYGA